MVPGLATKPMTQAHSAAAEELVARRNSDGGWGAAAGAPSNTECTALGSLALAGGSSSDPLPGVAWLLQHQDANGAWRFFPGGPESPWPTPIALLALRRAGVQDPAMGRGLAWLVEQRGNVMTWWMRLRDWFLGRKLVVELDPTLAGWPWATGAFSWVEPTAWALLALKAVGAEIQNNARSRIRDGEAMILDRECPGGGWNYGNSRVLGQDSHPYPDTTALALLGLRDRSTPAIDRGFIALDSMLDQHASGLALSLALLARRAWSRDATILKARLAEGDEGGEVADDTRTLALRMLALGPGMEWLGGGQNG